MKIALVGYGKMGVAIEKIAKKKGHLISFKIEKTNKEKLCQLNRENTDIVIEFSNPSVAVANILFCLRHKIPVVSGTTGWLSKWEVVKKACKDFDGTFFYASNYSIGVNLFFKLNAYAAKILANQPYQIEIEEIHHKEKKDSPSGTALSIAKPILRAKNLKGWVNKKTKNKEDLSIISKREDKVPGTHTITYASKIDNISFTHTAHNRKGFAKGALEVSEWIIHSKTKGMLDMNDFLTI